MLARVVFKMGSVVLPEPSIYMWEDYEASSHLRVCEIYTHGRPIETTWSEFVSTFYEGDLTVHGIDVPDVTCLCGQLEKRTLRLQSTVHEVAEAVFAELYEATRTTEDDERR